MRAQTGVVGLLALRIAQAIASDFQLVEYAASIFAMRTRIVLQHAGHEDHDCV